MAFRSVVLVFVWLRLSKRCDIFTMINNSYYSNLCWIQKLPALPPYLGQNVWVVCSEMNLLNDNSMQQCSELMHALFLVVFNSQWQVDMSVNHSTQELTIWLPALVCTYIFIHMYIYIYISNPPSNFLYRIEGVGAPKTFDSSCTPTLLQNQRPWAGKRPKIINRTIS